LSRSDPDTSLPTYAVVYNERGTGKLLVAGAGVPLLSLPNPSGVLTGDCHGNGDPFERKAGLEVTLARAVAIGLLLVSKFAVPLE